MLRRLPDEGSAKGGIEGCWALGKNLLRRTNLLQGVDNRDIPFVVCPRILCGVNPNTLLPQIEEIHEALEIDDAQQLKASITNWILVLVMLICSAGLILVTRMIKQLQTEEDLVAGNAGTLFGLLMM